MKDSVNTRFLDLQKVAETMTKARTELVPGQVSWQRLELHHQTQMIKPDSYLITTP